MLLPKEKVPIICCRRKYENKQVQYEKQQNMSETYSMQHENAAFYKISI